MVANPRAVRHFAQAMMQRSKNDQLDAVVLREFAARMPFKPWAWPKQNTLALWAIARRLEALTALCTAEKNRRHAARLSEAIPASVRRDLARSLRFHEQAMKQLRQEALRCITADAQLQRQYQLLQSVSGIGETSAIQLLAELALLPEDRDVRQWLALRAFARAGKEKTPSAGSGGTQAVARHLRDVPWRSTLRRRSRLPVACFYCNTASSTNDLNLKRESTKGGHDIPAPAGICAIVLLQKKRKSSGLTP
jgi:transposase